MADAEEQAYQKAYYERTKQLKGREPGKGVAPSSGSGGVAQAKSPDRQAARAAAAARVKALNGKLTQLRAALQKARANKPNDKPSEGESEAKKKAANEKYYNENKNEIKNDRKAEARKSGSGGGAKESASPAAPASRSVEEIEAAIRTTLVQLKAAVAKLKTL